MIIVERERGKHFNPSEKLRNIVTIVIETSTSNYAVLCLDASPSAAFAVDAVTIDFSIPLAALAVGAVAVCAAAVLLMLLLLVLLLR